MAEHAHTHDTDAELADELGPVYGIDGLLRVPGRPLPRV
jgi:hypothetical protein